jgi:hypothetical protein
MAVETLLVDEGGGGSSLADVQPSSLIGVQPNRNCSVPQGNSTPSWHWPPG